MIKKFLRVLMLVSTPNLSQEEIGYIIQTDEEYLQLFRSIVGQPLLHYVPVKVRELFFGRDLMALDRHISAVGYHS